jgi:transcription antitermination factor NusG
MENAWFALHTRHQHEAKVTRSLDNKGFETFLPMYQTTKRWSDRKKSVCLPLFPGYVFVSGIGMRLVDVLSTQGVATIVSTAGVPSAIPDEDMDVIRKAVSDVTKVEPYPYLQIGDTVCVHSGPLVGTRGLLIRRKDSYRLVVCVDILGRAAAVEINAADVEPVPTPIQVS